MPAGFVRRLDSPVEGEKVMERIGVDPAGIELMREKMISLSIEVHDISSPAANILKQEMLACGGEASVARGTANCSVEKSDILIHGTIKQLRQLAHKLAGQPFGLRDVGALIEDLVRNTLEGPRRIEVGNLGIPSENGPVIMGILNVTPDSFSDGGLWFSPDRAVERGLEMVEEGADIIDIGGESSRPGAEPVSAAEEWERVGPVLRALLDSVDVPISVDTYKWEVAEKALNMGAEIINDITGGKDERLLRAVADQGAALVLMHMKGTPRDMQKNPTYTDVVEEIAVFLSERAMRAQEMGVEKIILDPGIGFGKNLGHNLEVLSHLDTFRSLGWPVLVGVSRKSFIGGVLDLPVDERLEGTLASTATSIFLGADIVRVHDVRENRRAAMVAWAMRNHRRYR